MTFKWISGEQIMEYTIGNGRDRDRDSENEINRNNENDRNAENYLNGNLTYYDEKSVLNKKRYTLLVVLDITLSALIPFTTLFIDIFSGAKYIVALMGSVITVVSAFNATFGYHKLWIEYRMVAEALKHQKDLYINSCNPYNCHNKGEILISIVNSILEKENSNWRSTELSLVKPDKT